MLSNDQIIRLIFGFKVRYLRLQKGLSYQELSDLTGLSTSYLNDIEKGKRYPKTDKITILGEALGKNYNYMVATNASKKLQPIIDLLNSKFFKLFPLEEFGISMEKTVELFTQTPDRVNAFISTIFRIARNYQVGEKQFYQEALRSYQDMHNNYFKEIEKATRDFKEYYSIKGTLPYTSKFLEDQLSELYHISVDREKLSTLKNAQSIRSYLNPEQKVLYLHSELSEAQVNFLLARELGFQFMKIEERPYETTVINIDSFDQLLNNFRASYFAAALLIEEDVLVEDIRLLARENSWHPDLFLNLLTKYNVTPEMLLQRMTNILPHHFQIEDLFFIRLSGSENLKTFNMTKDLHLSQLHSPYNNELEEHYCKRWVSITILKELRMEMNLSEEIPIIADAQISRYWQTDKEYLCISMAKPNFANNKTASSVTIGMLITPHLKSIFHFLTDPDMKNKEVHTTCERCGIKHCEARAAPPVMIEKRKAEESLTRNLTSLSPD